MKSRELHIEREAERVYRNILVYRTTVPLQQAIQIFISCPYAGCLCHASLWIGQELRRLASGAVVVGTGLDQALVTQRFRYPLEG